MERRSKAIEFNVPSRTVRRRVADYELDGEAGLLDAHHRRASEALRGIDVRWLDELARGWRRTSALVGPRRSCCSIASMRA